MPLIDHSWVLPLMKLFSCVVLDSHWPYDILITLWFCVQLVVFRGRGRYQEPRDFLVRTKKSCVTCGLMGLYLIVLDTRSALLSRIPYNFRWRMEFCLRVRRRRLCYSDAEDGSYSSLPLDVLSLDSWRPVYSLGDNWWKHRASFDISWYSLLFMCIGSTTLM